MLQQEDKRRADLQNVVVAAGATDGRSDLTQSVNACPCVSGLELDANKETSAADCADLELFELANEVRSDPRRVNFQTLVLDHVEHRQRRGSRDGVAAKGTEHLCLLRELVGDLSAGD